MSRLWFGNDRWASGNWLKILFNTPKQRGDSEREATGDSYMFGSRYFGNSLLWKYLEKEVAPTIIFLVRSFLFYQVMQGTPKSTGKLFVTLQDIIITYSGSSDSLG